MEEKPFVKLFYTLDNYYLFDVNSNSILRISESVYHKVENLIMGKKNYQNDSDIVQLKKRGFLKPNNKNIEIKHSALESVGEYMKGNVRQLILQVTQNCNLRCKYCVYSGSYVNRTHTRNRMNFDIAKKAIDFYFIHNKNKDTAIISFYGGEPLLEFDLICKVVNYCERLYEGKKLQFNLTTNATLLTDEVVDFLYDHNFEVTVSLDGPEKVHNRSRVFADDKTGTFQCVMNNLKRIEERCSDYMKNINFNAVLDTTNDFKCSSNFFTYDFMKKAIVNATTLNENDNKEEIEYGEAFDINYRYEIFKCYLKYIGRLDQKYVSKIIDNHVSSLKAEIHEKIKAPYYRGQSCHPSGPCIAGAARLFVTVDGLFYPCERVNESCASYVIGNLQDGFYIEKVKDLLNIGALTAKQCKDCWAVEYCNSCAAGIDEGDELCPEKRLARCKGIKQGCEMRFIEYCTLREMGCSFE